MNVVASVEIVAGRLVLNEIRYILQQAKLKYPGLDFVESGGLIEHKFAVRGRLNDIDCIKRELDNYRG